MADLEFLKKKKEEAKAKGVDLPSDQKPHSSNNLEGHKPLACPRSNKELYTLSVAQVEKEIADGTLNISDLPSYHEYFTKKG